MKKELTRIKFISFILVLLVVVNMLTFVSSATDYSQSLFTSICNMDSSFLENVNQTPNSSRTTELETIDGKDAELVEFFYESIPCGYTIVVEDEIVEYSNGVSPYYNYINDGYTSFSYNYYNYSINDDEHTIVFTFDGSIVFDSTAVQERGTIPGVSPQLQNSGNCVACALSNIMWYWRSHGFPLIHSSFVKVMANISPLFYGNYANNSVPSVATTYLQNRSSTYHCNSTVYWSPSKSRVTTEIDAGFPCMLGYAAGSPYSSTVGHMTMCYGYYYSGSTLFVQLADGHSSSMVTRQWNSTYNDCVIKVRPNKDPYPITGLEPVS